MFNFERECDKKHLELDHWSEKKQCGIEATGYFL